MDEGSEHPKRPEELQNGEKIGKRSHFVSHVYKHKQSFFPKEPRGERLENNFANLFGRHLSLHALRLAAVFVGTS